MPLMTDFMNDMYILCFQVPGLSDIRRKKLSVPKMSRMNFAGLQVVVNDLHSQIEGTFHYYIIYMYTLVRYCY